MHRIEKNLVSLASASTIAGILALVGFLPYVWAIIANHHTAPSPVSWTIWVSVDILTFVAMRKKKADTQQLIGATIGAGVVAVLAIAFGTPTMGLIEWISIGGAILGIALWKKPGGTPLSAIICAQTTTFIGAWPTFAHGYMHAKEEDPIAWTIWLISCVFALIAVRKKWDLANALQPLTFTTIETVMVILVVIRPHL